MLLGALVVTNVMLRRLTNLRFIIIIIIYFFTLGIKSPEGFWKKIDTKENIVGVTITPSSSILLLLIIIIVLVMTTLNLGTNGSCQSAVTSEIVKRN